MTLDDLRASLAADGPPPDLSDEVRALWIQAGGDWDAAHVIVQGLSSPAADWVHAHLHREEGDLANAAYWYRKANRPVSQTPLTEEWNEIATALLAE